MQDAAKGNLAVWHEGGGRMALVTAAAGQGVAAAANWDVTTMAPAAESSVPALAGSNAYMERDVLADFLAWKESPFRKPLIVRGARQVGKTRALKEFGRRHYENVAYFSLEKIDEDTPSEYAQFFELTKDPARIVQNLSIAGNVAIEPGKTLLVLDEIQDCPAAVKELKN